MKTITYENLTQILYDKIVDERINLIDTEEIVEQFDTICRKITNREYDIIENGFDREWEIYTELANLVTDYSKSALRAGIQVASELFIHNVVPSEVSKV